jgi:hypothetical protein
MSAYFSIIQPQGSLGIEESLKITRDIAIELDYRTLEWIENIELSHETQRESNRYIKEIWARIRREAIYFMFWCQKSPYHSKDIEKSLTVEVVKRELSLHIERLNVEKVKFWRNKLFSAVNSNEIVAIVV